MSKLVQMSSPGGPSSLSTTDPAWNLGPSAVILWTFLLEALVVAGWMEGSVARRVGGWLQNWADLDFRFKCCSGAVWLWASGFTSLSPFPLL